MPIWAAAIEMRRSPVPSKQLNYSTNSVDKYKRFWFWSEEKICNGFGAQPGNCITSHSGSGFQKIGDWKKRMKNKRLL